MTAETYVKQIVKKVKCSGKKREEIRRQLLSDINTAVQQGEALNAVMFRMGEPIAIAEEFNQNFSDRERRLHKRGVIIKTGAVAAAVVIVLVLAAAWFLPRKKEIGDSAIFDAEVLEDQSKKVIRLLDAQDYESLMGLSNEQMQKALTKEAIDQAKAQTGADWGEFGEFGNCYMAEYRQQGQTLAVVQINAAYANTAVTYSLMFDEDMKLAGLYMK